MKRIWALKKRDKIPALALMCMALGTLFIFSELQSPHLLVGIAVSAPEAALRIRLHFVF